MSNYIVGLTGGIGSGKTTVTDEFERLGITVVDADVIARTVVEPGSDCLNAIAAQFGPDILLQDGTLNRGQLRSLIFADVDKKQWLNALMHPAINQLMLQQLKQAQSPYCILVAPLLFENKLERYVNTTVVVDIPEEIQIQRTSSRDDVSVEQVKNIIKAQISRNERLQKADDVIDNNQSWTQVVQQIPLLHAKYMAFCEQQT
ncbi:MAG: dephospho-CoA kinase [Phenylobacterium sp.]|jgi:dephospho-CoA kinase